MRIPFKFKQFTVNQDKCAMKIGTDSVLLGAWTSVEFQANSILDIGAGTGVLALMLAQRCVAETIDALEIDDDAFEQCVDNFEASPWADRLFCYHASLNEFTEEIEDKYDLIICNPPYFEKPNNHEALKLDESRANARFTSSLSYEELCTGVSSLMNTNGRFSVVVPFLESERFITVAERFNLYPSRILNVRGNPNSKLKRTLIEFSFKSIQPEIKELIIENARHAYTTNYIELTKEFYLKM